jgi:hypothetical protein
MAIYRVLYTLPREVQGYRRRIKDDPELVKLDQAMVKECWDFSAESDEEAIRMVTESVPLKFKNIESLELHEVRKVADLGNKHFEAIPYRPPYREAEWDQF